MTNYWLKKKYQRELLDKLQLAFPNGIATGKDDILSGLNDAAKLIAINYMHIAQTTDAYNRLKAWIKHLTHSPRK